MHLYTSVCVCVCVCVYACVSSLLVFLPILFQIQLTLFLKDLGLPVHQAIALWRHEYSQPCGAGSHCNHSWQEDSRRYTYNIRHLYGLEGARRNYHGHCCESLQVRSLVCLSYSAAQMDGIPPFRIPCLYDDIVFLFVFKKKKNLYLGLCSELLEAVSVFQFRSGGK